MSCRCGLLLTLLALPLVGAAVTWHPAADWREQPNPIASVRASRGGVIRFACCQAPRSLNAFIGGGACATMAFDLVYGKLLDMDPMTAELVPGIARRWAVSDDGRELTFEIDARACWSDGQPVTAADVKWTFDRIMDPRSDTGPWKVMLGMFASPAVVDERKVVFRKVAAGGRDWRDLLHCAAFWILPRHAFAMQDFNRLDLVGAPSGGPYVLARAEDSVSLELVRHGRWWRQDLPSCRGQYNFDRILLRPYADSANAYDAFRHRQVDVLAVRTAQDFARDSDSDPFLRNWIVRRNVRNHQPIGFQGFAMNLRRPPFDDLRVRQAMAMLLDRETVNRTMMGNAGTMLNSYFQDIYDAGHPCTNRCWTYDVAGARRLLAEAGHVQGFSFTFLSRSPSEDKFLSVFGQALRQCGVTMRVVRRDPVEWMRDMDDFNFDMTWIGGNAGVVKNPGLGWSGCEADRRGSGNFTGLKCAELDGLIAQERLMDDAAERRAAYRRMDALIAAAVPSVLLWQAGTTRLLHWNRLGMPRTVLSRFGREMEALRYWWHDEDRAEELAAAMANGTFLPAVPTEIDFDKEFGNE